MVVCLLLCVWLMFGCVWVNDGGEFGEKRFLYFKGYGCAGSRRLVILTRRIGVGVF